MKRNKKCWLRNLRFWQCQLIIGITAWLSAASFSPVFGQVSPSSVCPKTNCKWHDEYVIVTRPGLGKDAEKKVDDLLDALSKAIGVAAQVANLQKAIKEIGPAGDNPSVIVVYICFDPTTGVTLTKKETLGAESVWWAAKMDKAKDEAAKDRDRERARAIRALCGGNCCKVTPTPSPSPSPSPPTPTPTPKPSPPRTYTGPGQTPTPTPQEHGMAPRQPGKTGETCAVLIATGKIKVETSGTGETIGHVADLKIQNLTDQPVSVPIVPMILESASGKNQHYACPTGQAVALNAHQTKTVPMNGVCLNRNKPPVGKGVSADLVINEANPSGPQNPNSHIPANQAGDLLRICTAKYDAAATLQKDGALKNLPYKDKQKQKDIVVQWSTWCDPRISQITGAPPATKDDLKKVVYKQIEGPMSPETKKKVDQGIDTIFEKVELTTAKAKDLEKPPSSQAELTGEEAKSVSSTTTALPAVAVAQQERKPCCVILKIEFKVAGTKGKGEEVKDFLDKLTEELKKAGGEGAEQIGETGSKIIKGYEVIAGLTQPWEIYVTLGKGVCKGEKCEVKDKVECRLIPRTKSGQKDGIGGGEAGSERENWLPPTAKDWWKDVGIEELARALANILKYCECDDGSYTWPSPDAKPVSGCK